MQDELMAIQQQLKKTILFITHDLNEALRIGDRVCIMRGGRVVQIGTPEEILTKPASRVTSPSSSKTLIKAGLLRFRK